LQRLSHVGGIEADQGIATPLGARNRFYLDFVKGAFAGCLCQNLSFP